MSHGVRTTVLLVAPDEHVIIGVKKQHRSRYTAPQQAVHFDSEVIEDEPASGVNHQRQATRHVGQVVETHNLADQGRGEIVHNQITKILQNLGRRRSPGARHPGNHQYLRSANHDLPPLRFLLLWTSITRP